MVVNNSMIVGTMEAIAEMLGIKFTGNTDDIYEAIAHLKESNLKMLKDRAKPAKINILPHLLAEALNLDNEFDDDGILNAIANLKHSLELSQNEVEDLREKSAIADLKKSNQREDYWHGLYKSAKEILEAIANALGFEYIHSPYSKATILEAIANLKHSLQLSQDEVDELQGKAAIADQLQSDLAHTDIGELRSERNYYRGILDKLCDRLNIVDIEALENVVKHQEMNIDFVCQHNDDLRGKLAESQAMSLKYMNRIVELEREVRSLQEPVNRSSYFDSDRLSNPELIQIIRSLLR